MRNKRISNLTKIYFLCLLSLCDFVWLAYLEKPFYTRKLQEFWAIRYPASILLFLLIILVYHLKKEINRDVNS